MTTANVEGGRPTWKLALPGHGEVGHCSALRQEPRSEYVLARIGYAVRQRRIDFFHAQQLEGVEEYIAAMRELWSANKPMFKGDFVQFEAAHCQPQPINGSVPIIVGGHSKLAARRAGRLGNGFFPARGASKELIELARRNAEENNRDPNALEITVSLPNDLDQIPALAAAGVNRVLVPVIPTPGMDHLISGPDDLANWCDILDKYAEV